MRESIIHWRKNMDNLTEKKCLPCEGGVSPLSRQQAENMLKQIPQWKLNESATEISRDFQFKNFFRTMSFANVVAWIANNENHHPDMEIGYDRCKVRYSTHAIKGLSENDFICAAKIDQITTATK